MKLFLLFVFALAALAREDFLSDLEDFLSDLLVKELIEERLAEKQLQSMKGFNSASCARILAARDKNPSRAAICDKAMAAKKKRCDAIRARGDTPQAWMKCPGRRQLAREDRLSDLLEKLIEERLAEKLLARGRRN